MLWAAMTIPSIQYRNIIQYNLARKDSQLYTHTLTFKTFLNWISFEKSKEKDTCFVTRRGSYDLSGSYVTVTEWAETPHCARCLRAAPRSTDHLTLLRVNLSGANCQTFSAQLVARNLGRSVCSQPANFYS